MCVIPRTFSVPKISLKSWNIGVLLQFLVIIEPVVYLAWLCVKCSKLVWKLKDLCTVGCISVSDSLTFEVYFVHFG